MTATTDADRAVRLLEEVLAASLPALVRKLARQAGVPSAASGATLGRRIARALLKPPRLQAAVSDLAIPERELLTSLARAGGQASAGAVDWWLRRRGVAQPTAAVERLAARGLLFPIPRGAGDLASLQPGALWCPEPVCRLVAEPGPQPALPGQPAPSSAHRAALHDLVRDLFVLGRFLSAPRTLTTSRHLGRSDFAELAVALGKPSAAARARRLEDSAELLQLESLALQAGLVSGEDRRFVPVASAQAFFQLPAVEQSARLLEAAVTQTGWGELESVADLEVERPAALAPGHSDVPSPGARVRARRRIVEVLCHAAVPEHWHLAADLAQRVMDLSPDFLIRRRAPDSAAEEPTYRGLRRLRDGRPEPLGMVADWEAVEGAFVAQFLAASLRRVGIVDVAEGASPLFRVTDLGACVLGMASAAPPPEPPARFFVQPNFEIIADGGGDNLATVSRLAQVADLVAFDRAALFRLTRESVCRALDRGLTEAGVCEVLTAGGAPLPQNVSFSVAEWIAAHNRYCVRVEAWVIETDRPEELDALELALPGSLERLGPTAARVLPAERARVEAALAGRRDSLIIDHAEGLRQVLDLDENLRVTGDRGEWHWYLDHWLDRIAERLPSRGSRPRFRLTRDSLRRALANGLAPGEIEDFVTRCARRPLSARQTLLLRGWLCRYEPAQLAPVTLLRLPSSAREDLLALPEVRSALAGSVGSSAFVVRREAAAKLRRVLEEAGLAVEAGPGAAPLGEQVLGAVALASEVGPAWGRRRWQQGDAPEERESVLREAIARGRRVSLAYRPAVTGEGPQTWLVTPERLERTRWGEWRLHARCHPGDEPRRFDLSRVESLVVLDPPAAEEPA